METCLPKNVQPSVGDRRVGQVLLLDSSIHNALSGGDTQQRPAPQARRFVPSGASLRLASVVVLLVVPILVGGVMIPGGRAASPARSAAGADVAELREQLAALQQQLTQVQGRVTHLTTRPASAPFYPSIGALLRSMPPDMAVESLDNELQLAVSRKWFGQEALGRSIVFEFELLKAKIRTETGTILVIAIPVTEQLATARATVSLQCTFELEDLDFLAQQRTGALVRARGTISAIGFSKGTTLTRKELYLTIDHCRVIR